MTITFSDGMTVTGGGFTAAGLNLLQVVDQVSGNVLTLPTGVSVSTAVTQTGTTSSILFDGTSTAYLPYSSANVAVLPITIEYWIYPTDLTAGCQPIYMVQNADGTGSSYGVTFQGGGGGLGASVDNGSSGSSIGTYSISTLNTWTYIVMQVSANTMDIWVNGTHIFATYPTSSFVFGPGTYTQSAYNNLEIGRYNRLNSNRFNGYMGQVRLSSGARYSGQTITVPSSPLTVDGTTVALIQSVVK